MNQSTKTLLCIFFFSLNTKATELMKLSQNAAAAIDALLLARQSDLIKFNKSGNMTESIFIKDSVDGRKFVFTRKVCHFEGFTQGVCFGGSELIVNVKQIQNGPNIEIKSTSKVRLFK